MDIKSITDMDNLNSEISQLETDISFLRERLKHVEDNLKAYNASQNASETNSDSIDQLRSGIERIQKTIQEKEQLLDEKKKQLTSAQISQYSYSDSGLKEKKKNKEKKKKNIALIALVVLLVLGVVSQIHIHTWVDASCTEPKHCTGCGETEGKALGHDWIAATCTEPKKCKRCGETEGKELGHTWIEATCQSPKTCKVCGKTEGSKVSKNHVVTDWTVIQEPTCSVSGIKRGTCDLCGTEVDEAIEKIAHTPGDTKITKEATDVSPGEKSVICSVCGEIISTEKYTLTPAEAKEYFMNHCQSISYEELARYPDKYKGQYVKFRGEVIQVIEGGLFTTKYAFRINVTQQGSYYTYWDDTVYVTYKPKSSDEAKILEDDIVTFYGVFDGDYTYTTVLGARVTVPSVDAEYIIVE